MKRTVAAGQATSTDAARPAPVRGLRMWLFISTIFISAALVFLVQPMVAKLLLPMLGGAPAVWNTTVAFFQIMLLIGYAYAHFLQKLKTVRHQLIVHAVMLALAGLSLPLGITQTLGNPEPDHPILWLLGVLSLSVGAPFAALSATSPLVQAWFAARSANDEGNEAPQPYGLYAASNLGSLIALIGYPVIIEPLSHLADQRLYWSLGYGLFALLIIALGLVQSRRTITVAAADTAAVERPSGYEKVRWVLLAAAPSSLMLGVTTYLTTDVASAPFLWVAPLSLYLITFIIAFQSRPLIRLELTNPLHALMVCACVDLMALVSGNLLLKLALHLVTFFITALLCHQTLAARKPDPKHLTGFYFYMSLGGVLGGSFNAFVAPIVFHSVIEYPLVLVLACLARPWSEPGRSAFSLDKRQWLIFGAGTGLTLIAMSMSQITNGQSTDAYPLVIKMLIIVPLICAYVLRGRAIYFALLLGLATTAGLGVAQRGQVVDQERSFFGVVKISEGNDVALGRVRMMAHGTTLHGLQALTPDLACKPVTYYAPKTAIGQMFTLMQARKPSLNMGIVGLGTGMLATYVRPGDHLRYYEIDPLVVKDATNPAWFTYLSHCAKSPVPITIGDARLELASEPPEQYDFLMIDAFSSDAIPAHLLTVEAVRLYLKQLKPGGVVAFHLSNRHLELREPVMAAVRDAGGYALTQTYLKPREPGLALSSTIVVVAARHEADLADFRADARWVAHSSRTAKAWSDNYTNLIGAILANRNY
jgi:SAM-dependent methyltransferase